MSIRPIFAPLSPARLLWLGIALGAGASAGCSSEKAAGDCDDPTAETCDPGQACSGQQDCPAGTYCSESDHTCTADCTPGSDECGEGYFCAENGRCQDATCASIELEVDAITPSIEMVIDRSGSMAWDFAGNSNPAPGASRWDAVKAALIGGSDALIPTLQSRIYFGALLYYYNTSIPDQHLQTVETARGLNNNAAITNLLTTTAPSGGTPTSLAVGRAVARFDETPAPADSPKYILLVTDGEPTVPGTGSTQETNGSLTVTAIQDAYQAGITTLVLGVSTQIAAANLQRFANAGQGLAPEGGTNADYAVSNNSADLVADLTALLGATRSCDLLLQGSIDPSAASAGTVSLNGAELAYQTDWTIVNPTTLRLEGSACQAFLDSPSASVSANFPCNAVTSIY